MFTTIAVALDGTEHSQVAARYGAALAREHSGRIVVAHVRELIAGRGAGPLHVDEEERVAAMRTAADLRAQGIYTEVRRLHATEPGRRDRGRRPPRRGRCDRRRRDDARRAGRSLTGSTSPQLLHAAQCPVPVAPARGQAREAGPAVSADRTPIAA
jgi:hypothetical protein